MGKCFALFVVTLAVLVGFCAFVGQEGHFVYQPAKLQEISQTAIRNAKAAHGEAVIPKYIVEETIRLVLETYPETSRYTGRWLWNNAGGAMGSMTVLHCSFSEYLIIFGTPVGTEGHTGRYPLTEDYFNILYGEQWAALPGVDTGRETYKPGDQHFLPKNVAKQYRMPDECWALEYARGNIPSMLFFGFADMFSSTLDFVTVFKTIQESAGNMIPNMLKGKI